MKIALYIVGTLLLLLVLLVVWLITSVARGAKRRDKKLLNELRTLGLKLHHGEQVTQQEVLAMAQKPQLRFMLHSMLEHLQHLDLFPKNHLSTLSQAQASLAYWLMHPNEMGEAPPEIELVESIRRDCDGELADFFVYRYRMTAGHWAAEDGWLLGLVGPVPIDFTPYSSRLPAFSRCGDKQGEVAPAELVDWYRRLLQRKAS